MPDDTLVTLLAGAGNSTRGVRFLDRGERETFLGYAELWRRARAFAGGLVERGVAPGDRVALVLPTAPSFYDAFFGALIAGATPVPLYPPVRLGRLDEYHDKTAAMLKAARCRLAVTDGWLAGLVGPSVVRAAPELGLVRAAEVGGKEAAPAPVRSDDLAFIQFSSGTTAEPKPICLTHAAVIANVDSILAAILAAYPEGPALRHSGVSWLPLYHDMGLVGCVLVAVRHPGDLTLIPPEVFVAKPAVWLKAIGRYGATISPAPNFAYSLCADRVSDEDLAGVDLSGWRLALCGGEPITPQALDRFTRRFAPYGFRPEAFTPVYGLGEATLAVTFSPLGERCRVQRFARAELAAGHAVPAASGVDLVSVGRPLPGIRLRIQSPENASAELPERRVGEIWIQGPSLMQSYDGQPQALPDAWFNTGDTGFIVDGELYIYGRAKDVVIVRGRNYAPEDIERLLLDVPGIRTGCVAAVGVVEPEGEQLVLLVERARATRLADTVIARAASERVAEHTGLVPRRVVVCASGSLPRTSSGKKRRSEALRRHLAGELTPPKRVGRLAVLAAMFKGWRALKANRG